MVQRTEVLLLAAVMQFARGWDATKIRWKRLIILRRNTNIFRQRRATFRRVEAKKANASHLQEASLRRSIRVGGHHHAFANFAFAYAFSAGIALPGFLSLLCYVPKEKKLPWAYLALYHGRNEQG